MRKSGQYNVSAVLKGSAFMVTSHLRPDDDKNSDKESFAGSEDDDVESKNKEGSQSENDDAMEIHPAADLVADFLIGQLKGSGNLVANKSTIHMLVFTRQVIMAMPKNKLQVTILIFHISILNCFFFSLVLC